MKQYDEIVHEVSREEGHLVPKCSSGKYWIMTSVCSCINRNGSSGNPQSGWSVHTSSVPLFGEMSVPLSLRKPDAFATQINTMALWPPRAIKSGVLPTGPSPCCGRTHIVSCPCQVAMETDLEVSKIDLYLLGTCSLLDAVTSIKQRERERGMPSPSPICGLLGRYLSATERLEKLNGKDFFFLPITLCFFFLITKVIYIHGRQFVEIQKSTQTHKLSTIPSPRDNTVNILAFCLSNLFYVLI